jgi:RNA polymerase sigma-70 factor (ECF subfamily)
VKERGQEIAPGAAAPGFDEVFRQHTPYLWRALVGLGVRRSDADDLCQEVMLVVHRRLAEIDGRALKSWLYGICLRVASDYRRSARIRREQASGALPEEPLPATQPDEVDARRAEARLLSVLDELDEEKRAAFVLFEIEGLTLREIAEAMACPLQTAYSRLQAARARVREAFSSELRARSA